MANIFKQYSPIPGITGTIPVINEEEVKRRDEEEKRKQLIF